MTPDRSEKLRVGVLFGGRSAEHEVSLASAAGIMAALDGARYEIVPLLVTRQGKWLLLPRPDAPETEGREVFLPAAPGGGALRFFEGGEAAAVDVFFPIIHGSFGEDGTLQGFLELADTPFVGSGCLSSALSMDKGVAKAVLRAAGLPTLPSMTITRARWEAGPEEAAAEAAAEVGFPLFVKPAALGSSVGVRRLEDSGGFAEAVAHALEYDDKILAEEDAQGREFECAVLEDPEGGPLLASPVAEIRSQHGWYDYESKYTPGLTDILIPAPLPESEADRVRAHARAAFTALGCSGLARVDFFYREASGEIYLSELNTLPGFTPLSGYPKMIEAAGFTYPAMLDRLIACARARWERSRARNFRRPD